MKHFLAALCLFGSVLAIAAPRAPYEESLFRSAQASGAPVIVEIHADWCGECKMQDRVLTRLVEQPAYASLVRLRINYDTQKELVRAFGANHQSTLVLYRGAKEVARAVGITSEAQIRELLNKAI